MNTKEVADLLGVVPNTVRRLTSEYHKYLTGGAHPPKGQVRIFDGHDLRVLHYIQAERELGRPYDTIHAHLQAMEANEWADLPDVPPEWNMVRETMPITQAAARAYDVATLAVMQRDLAHAQQQLAIAQTRVTTLETEIATLRASGEATEARNHALELELSQARGDVAELRARLDAYALAYGMGRGQPLPLAALIAITALAVLVALVLMLIVVRLVL